MCNGGGIDLNKEIHNVGNEIGKGISNVGNIIGDGVGLLTGDKQRSMERKQKREEKKAKDQLDNFVASEEKRKRTEMDKFLTGFQGRSNTILGGNVGSDNNLFSKKLLGE